MPADSPTFMCLADAAKEFGAFMAKAAEAVADGQVTANELAAVEKEFGLLIAKGQACLVSLAAIHKAGKPLAEQSEVRP